MEPEDIKTVAQLIEKERQVGEKLREALLSGDLDKVPHLTAEHWELTHEIHEILPDADPLIDL